MKMKFFIMYILSCLWVTALGKPVTKVDNVAHLIKARSAAANPDVDAVKVDNVAHLIKARSAAANPDVAAIKVDNVAHLIEARSAAANPDVAAVKVDNVAHLIKARSAAANPDANYDYNYPDADYYYDDYNYNPDGFTYFQGQSRSNGRQSSRHISNQRNTQRSSGYNNYWYPRWG